MKKINKYRVGLIPKDLRKSSIPILLSAYRFGIYIAKNILILAEYELLSKAGYIEYHSIKSKTNAHLQNLLVILTDKGGTWVKNNAIGLLTSVSPYYMYPIILPGDIISVKSTPLAYSNNGHVTLVETEKCDHTVHSIDKNSVMMSPEHRPSSVKRVSLRPCKDHLSFVTNIDYSLKEFNNRVGKVNIRTILDRADDTFNGLLISDMLDKMYNRKYVKNRIVKS